MNMKQCLLFDCDGTLVDSELLCNIGLTIKFREQGIELDADELVMSFRGCKLADILQVLQVKFDIRLSNDFMAEYRL